MSFVRKVRMNRFDWVETALFWVLIAILGYGTLQIVMHEGIQLP